jgi:hypothetical protein
MSLDVCGDSFISTNRKWKWRFRAQKKWQCQRPLKQKKLSVINMSVLALQNFTGSKNPNMHKTHFRSLSKKHKLRFRTESCIKKRTCEQTFEKFNEKYFLVQTFLFFQVGPISFFPFLAEILQTSHDFLQIGITTWAP